MKQVVFNPENHSYTLGNKKLISITQLMQKHNLAPCYDDVDSATLERAAARGTEIHKAIENYITLGFECADSNSFQRYVEANNIVVLQNEYMVYNDIAAGTIDLILADNETLIIADIKTTYEVHKDAISWQLSLYKALLGKQYRISKGQCIHIDKRTLELEVIDIELKPEEEVNRLLECERNGLKYEPLYMQAVNNTINSINELEMAIKGFKEKVKRAEEQEQELKQALMDYMKENSLYNIKTDKVSIAYIPEGKRKGLDQTKLRERYPDIYELCQSESTTKESIRITVRKEI